VHQQIIYLTFKFFSYKILVKILYISNASRCAQNIVMIQLRFTMYGLTL